MSIEMTPIPDDKAFWAVVISALMLVTLLCLPVSDGDLRKVQRMFATLAGLLGFGIAVLWVLSNYVFVPGP